jgi:hypothetical protein
VIKNVIVAIEKGAPQYLNQPNRNLILSIERSRDANTIASINMNCFRKLLDFHFETHPKDSKTSK